MSRWSLVVMELTGLALLAGGAKRFRRNRKTPAHLVRRGALGCQSRSRVCGRDCMFPTGQRRQVLMRSGGVCVGRMRLVYLFKTGWGLAENQLGHAQAHASRSLACIFNQLSVIAPWLWSAHTHSKQCSKQQTHHNSTQPHTTTHNHTPPEHNRQHTTDNTQPTTHNQQHTTNNTQPTNKKQQHTSNNTQYATHNQQPTTNKKQHTTNNQQETTNNNHNNNTL